MAQIFRGAAPGELPIEEPTHYAFAINLKTAMALSLTVPLAPTQTRSYVRPFASPEPVGIRIGETARSSF